MLGSEFLAVLRRDEPSVVKQYIQQAMNDFIYLEENVFPIEINGVIRNVEFRLAELPNDMKFLCFLAGELKNGAHYFTTFADVNSDNSMKISYSLGVEWKPFPYEKRLSDAKMVSEFKLKVAKLKVTEAVKRTKVTNYIGRTLLSRQEFLPPALHFVDRDVNPYI